MKDRRLAGAISTTLLLIALAISGCAIDPKNAVLKERLARYSSGWVGVEIVYKMSGWLPSHTIISVTEGTPASREGIRAGDEIMYIGQDNAGYMDTQEVARRLQEADPRLVLSVKRKGEKDLLSFVITKADTSSAKRLEPPKGSTAGVSPAQAQEQSKGITTGAQDANIRAYKTEWGFKAYTENNNFIVAEITPRSPAEDAGLKTGDVFIAMDGVAVKGLSDFVRPPCVPIKLTVRRGGAEIERTIIPGGILRLKVSDINQTFTIPGVPAHENPTAVSAIDALDFINVLDQVVLDPKSGQIEIIGHYDKAYDTGSIPYLDLLKTAMANPSPILNLQETPDTKKEMIAAGDKVRSDLKHMVDAVRGHPDFERERQLMIRELSKAYGLTPEEYVDWYNYVKLDNKEILPPRSIRDIQVKVFSNLGYTEVAKALELSFENTSDAAVKALQVLGHGDKARSILGGNAAGTDGMRGELMAATYLAIPQTANIVSAKELEPLIDWYRTKKITWEVAIKNVQNMLMPYTPKGKKDSNIMVEVYTRIFLSPKAVMFLEGLPTPYVYVVPIDLDVNSQLARIMYEADYALKSLSVMPELFQHIPGSLSRMEYQNKHGMFFEGTTLHYRQWLEPKMVDMNVSPDHRAIHFNDSQMRYLFADNSKYWEVPPNEELERGFAAWCGHFMDNYDVYARIVPAFHKIREGAKVLALAKWALAENIQFDLRNVAQEKWNTPEQVPAYWALSQGIYGTTGRMATIRAFEGGVSFKARGNWTRITPSTTTTTEASAQLTLSAQIGQKAVQAATAGDLETARYLSELSAQALTGGVSRAELIKLNVPLADPVALPASPGAVLLQKEMIKKTHEQIVSMEKNPASHPSAAVTLDQIKNLYDQVRENPASASDYLHKLQTRQLSTVSVPIVQPVPKPSADDGSSSLQLRRELLGGLSDSIHTRNSGSNVQAQEILRSLKTKKPPELASLTRSIDNLVPGDVILVSPVPFKDWEKAGIGDVLISNGVNLLDRWGSNNWSSPASHAAIFLGERNGIRWYMDNTSEHGPVIIQEKEFLNRYGQRQMDVATLVGQPISAEEGRKIFEAAHRLRDEGIGYGIWNSDKMVCSESARWLLLQAGREVPETQSANAKILGIPIGLNKKDFVKYSPADSYDNEQYIVIHSLDMKRK